MATVAPLSRFCGSSIIGVPPLWIVTVLVMLPILKLVRGNTPLNGLLIPALIIALLPIGTESARASDLYILIQFKGNTIGKCPMYGYRKNNISEKSEPIVH